MKHALAFTFLVGLVTASTWGDYHPQITHPPGDVSYNVFVGRYGESFDFYDGDVLEAEMHGAVEVIRIHPKWDPTQSLSGLPDLFHPKESDYVPANFEKYHFQELLVIPKGLPGGADSLGEIKAGKLAQAKNSGVIFEVREARKDPAEKWPSGTFEIRTMVPYALSQTYTQTPDCFLILTSGVTGVDSIDESLSYFLYRKYGQVNLKPVRHVPHNTVVIWLICNGLFLILVIIPIERWRRRLRLLGLSLLGFSNGLFFLSIALGAAALRLHFGQSLHWGAIFISVFVVGLLGAGAILWRLKSSNWRLVLLVAGGVGGFLVWQVAAPETPVLDSTFAYLYIGTLYLCGIILGLAIGVLSRFEGRIGPDRSTAG